MHAHSFTATATPSLHTLGPLTGSASSSSHAVRPSGLVDSRQHRGQLPSLPQAAASAASASSSSSSAPVPRCVKWGALRHSPQHNRGLKLIPFHFPPHAHACSARGGAAPAKSRRGPLGFLSRLAPGPEADFRRKLDWEFLKIAAPGRCMV